VAPGLRAGRPRGVSSPAAFAVEKGETAVTIHRFACPRALVSCLLVALNTAFVPAHAAVWYVDMDNTSGIEDGTSWATAYATIQPAIDAAWADAGGEVWVAEGVYSEERESYLHEPPIDTGSLMLREGTHMYGGFIGTESAFEQRNWRINETVIDGSGSRDGDTALHVAVGANDSTIDGFTFIGGAAILQGPIGGGLYNLSASPTVRNTLFRGNTAQGGAAIGNRMGASPTIFNCVFEKNVAEVAGSAISTSQGFPLISNCIFRDNVGSVISNSSGGTQARLMDCVFQDNEAQRGAAILNWVGADAEILDCTFLRNRAQGTADSVGGAILHWGTRLEVSNSVFWGNSTTGLGGAIYSAGSYDPWSFEYSTGLTLTNCSFANNTASAESAGVHIGTVFFRMRNSILWGNDPEQLMGSGIPDIEVVYSDIQGGFAGDGNISQAPWFIDRMAGDLRLSPLSPCIDTGTAVDAPETDIAGLKRPLGLGVDMGAYEFVDTDVNGDGAYNALDVQTVINAALGLIDPALGDVTEDGTTNAVDIQHTILAALAFG
jgi:parallel beta helix pectate lyase-like protein/dockerin type I repeat protein